MDNLNATLLAINSGTDATKAAKAQKAKAAEAQKAANKLSIKAKLKVCHACTSFSRGPCSTTSGYAWRSVHVPSAMHGGACAPAVPCAPMQAVIRNDLTPSRAATPSPTPL